MHDMTKGQRPKQKLTQKFKPRPWESNIFDEVKGASAWRIERLVRAWVPGARRSGDHLIVPNPKCGDLSPSNLIIDLHTGSWNDRERGYYGKDIISFYAYFRGLTQLEAARDLAMQLGVDA
ncbi:hypothetical protein [Celeribacter sp.]|uniref:hypothetical protein n=1 Tax=Celeribacter sp. TaxID=1890673 RepID=UPI003A8E38DF